MSQEQPSSPPIEIVIKGVIEWNENSIISNLPPQPEIANLSKGKTLIPIITRATLMLDDGGEEYITNISITAIRSRQGSKTTTYEYAKTGP